MVGKILQYAVRACLALAAVICLVTGIGGAQAQETPQVAQSRQLTDDGGTLDWCKAKNIIAFDRQVDATHSEVFTIRPNGTYEKCVTCGLNGMPSGVRGRPVWHPSCEYLAIQVQGPYFQRSAYENLSWGFHSDIWFVAADGSWTQKVVSAPLGGALLEPRFSDDGLMLTWADRRATGKRIAQSSDPRQQTPGAENPWDGWALAVADVVPRPGARVGLTNRRHVFARREGFVEPSAFVGGRIWHARNQSGLPFVDEVRNVDVDGRDAVFFATSTGIWKDRPVPSPKGNLVAFSSSKDFNWHFPPDLADTLRTELWVLDASQKMYRLTDVNNTLRPGERALSIDHSWGPNGREIAVYTVIAGIGTPKRQIDILTLDKAY